MNNLELLLNYGALGICLGYFITKDYFYYRKTGEQLTNAIHAVTCSVDKLTEIVTQLKEAVNIMKERVK